VDTAAVAYETEVSFTVTVSGDAAAGAVMAQLADTSAEVRKAPSWSRSWVNFSLL
jgi:hypothetical protein